MGLTPEIELTTSPPADVKAFDVFFINGTGSGDWNGHSNEFALSLDGVQSGGTWLYSAVVDGIVFEDKATGTIYLTDGGALLPIRDTSTQKNTSTKSGTTLDDVLDDTITIGEVAQNDIITRGSLGTWVTPNVGQDQYVGRNGAGALGGQTLATMVAQLLGQQSGTSFPQAPTNGQRFYRTDLYEWFTYNSSVSRWVGETTVTVLGGDTRTLSSYTTAWGETGGVSIAYGDTIGWCLPWDAICIGMGMITASTDSGTMSLMDDGSAVSNCDLAFSSQTKKTQAITNSGVIAADSIIGFKITSGNLVKHIVSATLRRLG